MPAPRQDQSSGGDKPSGFLVVATLILVALLFLTGLYAYSRLGATPAIGSRWLQEMMAVKTRAAERLPGERLLVVGGSSALFGLLAGELAAETGLPAANLSLHNNVSPDYLFHWAKRHARPGDTLLLALEYNYYTFQGIPDMQMVDYVLTLDPAYFHRLPPGDRLLYVGALGMDRLRAAIGGLFPRPVADPGWENPIPGGQMAYQPRSFDYLGDQTWNQVPRHTRHLDRFYAVDLSKARPSPEGTASIAELSGWCRRNGVRLVATYPPFLRDPLHDPPRQQRFFASIRALYAELGVPLLGGANDFRYPKDWFYDTEYHLHLPAARAHSRTVGRLLREYLAGAPTPP